MIKRLMLLLVLCGSSLFANGTGIYFEWETGNNVSELNPSGIYRLVFKDGSSSSMVVTGIAVMDNGMCELELTTPVLSNGTAEGTYPVVVRYYLKVGDEVTFTVRRNPVRYSDDGEYKVKLNSYTWNKIRWEFLSTNRPKNK